jgi:hypothetical protein
VKTVAPPPQESPDLLPKRTTPTWEMELLVSGATVFGLLQLPGWVDALLFHAMNASEEALAGFIAPFGIYVQFALLALVGTFLLHLCLRGYWVALVGLHSVYPDGIRWERLNFGHYYLETFRRASASLPEQIERVDNRATRVFGVGFGLAMVVLMPILAVGALILVLLLAQMAGWNGGLAIDAFWALFAFVFGSFFVVYLVDRLRGAALHARGRGAWLRWCFDRFEGLGFWRMSNPLLLLYSSQEGSRRTLLLMVGVMIPALLLVSGRLTGSVIGWDSGAYDGLPAEDGFTRDVVHPVYYASLRGAALTIAPQPHIPDPLVSEPYLRLFLPYRPRRHTPALERECPQALRDADQGAGLRCLARLQPIAIDGVPVQVELVAASDPRTGQRGMLAMIPVHGLAPGRHELTVMPAPRRPEDEAREPSRPHRIPFWK